jgi:hypothetical protein
MWLDYIYKTDPSRTISTNQSVLVNWVATTPTTEVVLTSSSTIWPGTYKLDIRAKGVNMSVNKISVKILHDSTQLSEPVFTLVEPGSSTMSTTVGPPITTTYSARVGLLSGTNIWFWKAGFDINYLDAVGATFTDDAGVTITITELKSDNQNTGGSPAVQYTVDQPPFMANQHPIASYFDIDIESVSTTVTGVEITANLTTPITTQVILGTITYTSIASVTLPFTTNVINVNNELVDIPIEDFVPVFNVHVTPPTNPPFEPRESRFHGMWGFFPISQQFIINDIIEVPLYINTGEYVLSGFAFNAYYASHILEPIDFELSEMFIGAISSHTTANDSHDANDAYHMKYMVVSVVSGNSFSGRNINVGKVRFRVKTDDYAEYLRLTDSPESIGNASLVEYNRFPIFKLHVTSFLNEMGHLIERDRVGYVVSTDDANEYHAYSPSMMHSYGYFISPVLNP